MWLQRFAIANLLPAVLQSEGAPRRLQRRRRKSTRSSGLYERLFSWRMLKMSPWERWVQTYNVDPVETETTRILFSTFNTIRMTRDDGWQAYCVFLDVWCCLCVMLCYDTSCATVLSFELKVLKVDGAYVAVKFPGTSSSVSSQSAAPTDSDPSSLLQDCRLLRIDELQVKAHAWAETFPFAETLMKK